MNTSTETIDTKMAEPPAPVAKAETPVDDAQERRRVEEAICRAIQQELEDEEAEIKRLAERAKEKRRLLAEREKALQQEAPKKEARKSLVGFTAAFSLRKMAGAAPVLKRTIGPVQETPSSAPRTVALSQKEAVDRLLEKKDRPGAVLKGYVIPPKTYRETREFLESLGERKGCVPHIAQTQTTTWFIADSLYATKIHDTLVGNGVVECSNAKTKENILRKLKRSFDSPQTPSWSKSVIAGILEKTAIAPRSE
ncbi:MAG: uncharacterized protein A8A55_2336 [Amphiamblys sp. WSBS2006]|nr:MAG: uncharacterized protein A8A55_2336 [Amphiamblys sp. WSBS2006]